MNRPAEEVVDAAAEFLAGLVKDGLIGEAQSEQAAMLAKELLAILPGRY